MVRSWPWPEVKFSEWPLKVKLYLIHSSRFNKRNTMLDTCRAFLESKVIDEKAFFRKNVYFLSVCPLESKPLILGQILELTAECEKCFNLRPAGGLLLLRTPLRFFPDCQKTAALRAAVFGTPYHTSFPHMLWNFRPRSRKVESPGHVKWPHLMKSLNVRPRYQGWSFLYCSWDGCPTNFWFSPPTFSGFDRVWPQNVCFY